MKLSLLLLAVAAFGLAGCGYADRIDPPTYLESSEAAAREAARLHAADIGGSYHQNVCCGSMEPLIHKGDYIVTKVTPWGNRLKGRVCGYLYHNDDGTKTAMLHRFVSGDADTGFIASGDNNPRSESWNRVLKEDFLFEAVAIYRVAQ